LGRAERASFFCISYRNSSARGGATSSSEPGTAGRAVSDSAEPSALFSASSAFSSLSTGSLSSEIAAGLARLPCIMANLRRDVTGTRFPST
jgi:hypothetical protein